MMKIIVDVNLACDHVPVELYEYEIGEYLLSSIFSSWLIVLQNDH